MGFCLKIYLSKLRDVTYEMRDIDGIQEECAVIPIRRNGIKRTKNGSTIMQLAMNEKRPNSYHQTHYLSILADKELKEEAKALGFEDRFKYLGSAKLVQSRYGGAYAGDKISLDDAMNI